MFAAAKTPPRLLTLILLTGLALLSLNMFLPSLSNMAAAFQVDYGLVSLSIAGYLAITAVLQIIMGPLSDRFGRRPVLLSALAIYTAASMVCALTTNIWLFLTFRVLQGAVTAGTILSMAIIRDTAPPQQAASRMGYVSMVMAVAPMLGPMLGGGLDELFGWRASFFTYVILGLVMLAVCWTDLGETNTSPSATFGRQLRHYLELLHSGRYWGFALCATFSTGAFYVFLAGAPLVANATFQMSPAVLGFCMGTITAGFMFGSFLSGRLAKRYRLTTMMLAGRLCACGGLAAGLLLQIFGAMDVGLFFAATIFVGIGNGLTMPSTNAGALSVRPDLAGSAAGLLGALTVGGGAALTWITGALLNVENAAFGLLAIMLAVSLTSLMATLYLRRQES